MEILCSLLCSMLSCLLCCGGTVVIFLLIVGVVVLRKSGQEKVTAKEAMEAGVESVSQVFTRGSGGLEEFDEDDEDE